MRILSLILLLAVILCVLGAHKRTRTKTGHVKKVYRTYSKTPSHKSKTSHHKKAPHRSTNPNPDPEEKEVCNVDNDGMPCDCDTRKKTIDCGDEILRTARIRPQYDTRNSGRQRMDVEKVLLNNNAISSIFTGHLVPGHEQKIKDLDLSDNEITFMERGCLDKFEKLEVLNLRHNHLRRIEEGVLSDSLSYHLERLQLEDNQIYQPQGALFKQLSMLKYLTLDNNPLTEITNETFLGLDELVQLSLDHTGLSHIGKGWFLGLPRLTTLSLRGNNFLKVPDLHGLSSLTNLDLSQTHITEINSNVFQSLKYLEQLTMEKNRYLWGIEDCAFCGLTKLKTISLNDNKALIVIDFDAFGQKTYFPEDHRLELVDVSNCNLSTLDGNMLPWAQVEIVKLAQNPWHCNCDIAWIVNTDVNIESETAFNQPKCVSPSGVEGRLLTEEKNGVLNADLCHVDDPHPYHGRSFVFMVAILILCSLLITVLWYLCSRQRTRPESSPPGPTDNSAWFQRILQKKPTMPRYGYRNLVMQQEARETAFVFHDELDHPQSQDNKTSSNQHNKPEPAEV